jgi:hypothetical protein
MSVAEILTYRNFHVYNTFEQILFEQNSGDKRIKPLERGSESS